MVLPKNKFKMKKQNSLRRLICKTLHHFCSPHIDASRESEREREHSPLDPLALILDTEFLAKHEKKKIKRITEGKLCTPPILRPGGCKGEL